MKNLKSDFIGGATSSLIALPSAIAFGTLIFAPLGPEITAKGALAGCIGAVVLPLIAGFFGGAPRLISAPCAPAAAVLSAFVLGAKVSGQSVDEILGSLLLISLITGLLQISFGAIKGGRLIKYLPYPVISGYLTAVGILLISAQIPKFFGSASNIKIVDFLSLLRMPSQWDGISLMISLATSVSFLFFLRLNEKGIIKRVPAPVSAILAGLTCYWGLAYFYPELAVLTGNARIIGPPPQLNLSSLFSLERFSHFSAAQFRSLVGPALTLGVLLSVDTLKTCVVLDAITRSRHQSNRELLAQGIANFANAILGGIPGAGTMGASLINITGGAKSKFSAVFSGLISAVILILFARWIAWIPVSVLAGLLLVLGFRMVDKNSFTLALHRTTFLDFSVILAVILSAMVFNLITAAGVGLGLAIILFIREQIRGSVIRRKMFGNQIFSKRRRLEKELAILEQYGDQTLVIELHGALFFGTTDQLLNEVDPHLGKCQFIILDMKRVQSVDFSAAHLFHLFEDRVSEKGGSLIFTHLPNELPTGQDIRAYFHSLGLTSTSTETKIFNDLDTALEFTENELLKAHNPSKMSDDHLLDLTEVQIFSGFAVELSQALFQLLKTKNYEQGSMIFKHADSGDELYIIRRGEVKIALPLQKDQTFHLATFGKGDFFGDMAFLDHGIRSAQAIATQNTDLYVLSRNEFDKLADLNPTLGYAVFSRMARILALRLRHTDAELRALEES